ncbi:hypothetical protein VTK73DRAFT_2557 [Phialemonium thermophilum]|uniref:Asteroid domain-containing protein n=1 Tax=Phialemonium thermophilum TaxID=223376 RepID=A0ABR3X3N1_9PEZI
MGVPHLKRHLQPYAQFSVLRQRELIIDGPGLAYHIFHVCQCRSTTSSPLGQPSYSLLCATALAWLDKLVECGASVSAIYFDGYLPDSKIHERRNRLFDLSNNLRSYFSVYPNGVPAGLELDEGRTVAPFPALKGSGPTRRLPIPAFAVPAIIEALIRSPSYGSRTRVVPGEADAFCAMHARLQGGTIITSDSDLLIYDLGPDGSVVFFADIDLRTESLAESVIAAEYIPLQICARLSLPEAGGMLALAFELAMDRHLTLEKALARARENSSSKRCPLYYRTFADEYLVPEVVEPANGSPALALPPDPRISELLLTVFDLACRRTEVKAEAWAAVDHDIESIPMYLPFLFDSPSRTSAWEASRSVREIAYGLLQIALGCSISEVAEFRRLHSSPGGTRVRPAPLLALEGDCLQLSESLARVRAISADDEEYWTLFCILQDVSYSVAQEKRAPLSLQVLGMDKNDDADTIPWDLIHFTAQAQGTLYSLRIIQQVMNFVFRQNVQEMPPAFAQLLSRLSALHAPEHYPQVASYASLIQKTRDSGSLSSLASSFEFPDDMREQFTQVVTPKRHRSKEKPRKRRNPERSQSQPSNLFALLDAD